MALQVKIKSHPDVIIYFKELPLKNQKFEPLKDIYLLCELLFYEELNVIKTDHTFKGYARSYKGHAMSYNYLKKRSINSVRSK